MRTQQKNLLSSVIIMVFLLLWHVSFGQHNRSSVPNWQDTLSPIRRNIEIVQQDQNILSKRVDDVMSLVESSTSVISNDFSSSNRVLTIFALVISIAAIVLGVYVAIMHHQIRKTAGIVKRMSIAIERKRKEVTKMADGINNNFEDLFKRIRRADTVEYLKRLEMVPKDVVNLVDILVARELEPEDYKYLRNAYMALIESGDENESTGFLGGTYGGRYRLLLFQHFFGQSILDDRLRDGIMNDMDRLVLCCFDNDIKKSMSEVAPVLSKRNVSFDRVSVLKTLLTTLRKSKFKENKSIIDILRNGIADEELWAAANPAENR